MVSEQQRLVILGAGTGGTLPPTGCARSSRRIVSASTSSTRTTVTCTNRACCSCRSGWPSPTRSCASATASSRRASTTTSAPIDSVDIEANTVVVAGERHHLAYDVLLIATGAVLLPDETEGLTGPGWREKVHTFYDMEGATALAGALADFEAATS
jgi:sulfide:quinone oxidoreductase